MSKKNILPIIVSLALGGLLFSCKPAPRQVSKSNQNLTLRIVYGKEIGSYVKSVAELFNLSNPELPDGSKIELSLVKEDDIKASKKIANGHLKTHLWLAASTSLVNYTNVNLKNLGPEQIECEQLFATPIVVATKPKQIRMFEAKERVFSWQEVLVDSFGFSGSADPKEHNIHFNHASPTGSAAGLGSLIQLAYFAAGKEGALNETDLANAHLLEQLRNYQNSAFGYGVNELVVLNNLAATKGNKVRFSITTEQQLALYNFRYNKLGVPIIALYPSEGSYWVDYSLCLSNADWSTAAHRAAVKILTNFLSGETAQLEAMKRGFRPSRLPLPPQAPLTKEFGVDVTKGQKALLPVSGKAVAQLLERWPELLRPSAIYLVLDTSGSMEGAALRVGKELFRNILASSTWRDLKGLVSFATEPRILSELVMDSKEIIPLLDPLKSSGGSAVYDGIKKAADLMMHADLNSHRKTILVFTDGEDKNSKTSLKSMLALGEHTFVFNNINLIILGVGHDSDFSDLKAITKLANGWFREGGLDEMKSVFGEVMMNL